MTATATSFSLLSTLPDAPPEATRLCNQIEFFSEQINKTTQSVPCPAELLASLSISSTPIPSTTPSNSDKSTQLASSAIESSEQNTLLSSQTSLTVSSSGLASKPAGPVSNSTGPTDKRGLEGGAVAGIAIGMLLAGALIAGVIFFCLLRRQKKQLTLSTSTYPRQHAPYTEWNVGPEKGATVVTVPGRGIDNLLPQPAEDDAITGDLSKIRDNIKNHVRTYYHSERISAGNINENGIRDIAALTGGSAADAAKMLEDPLTRDSALRLIIGSVVLTRCTGERSPSLLPNDVAALSASMPAGSANNAQSALYSKWKVVTGALLQQRYGKQSQDNGRSQTISDTIASLDSILAPFIKSSADGGQRRKNLDMILTRAANFAFLLFSQPGTFRFDFTSGNSGLTVFPALVQTVGDQGQPLTPAKVLTEKEVAAA